MIRKAKASRSHGTPTKRDDDAEDRLQSSTALTLNLPYGQTRTMRAIRKRARAAKNRLL